MTGEKCQHDGVATPTTEAGQARTSSESIRWHHSSVIMESMLRRFQQAPQQTKTSTRISTAMLAPEMRGRKWTVHILVGFHYIMTI